MIDQDWWPENYFVSRDQFLALARSCGAQTQSYNIEPMGPEGEPLTVDVASFTTPQDEHRIVLTSGVHGVEGFIGASVQIQALRQIAQTGIPNRIGITMIHAVNPWGFAHLRRVDENNIDINRNFINFETTQPTSPSKYAVLDPVINPQTTPSSAGEFKYWLSTGILIAKNHGIKKLAGPIAEGQCDFPKGLFFTGLQISASRALLEDLIVEIAANVPRISILDIHSGLGPAGRATLIGNSNLVSAEKSQQRLQAHYRQPVVMDNASDNAYNAQGCWSQWCQHALRDKHYLYLCVEIGTVNPLKLFSAIRRENQAHHWSPVNSKTYKQTKQALRNVFAPAKPSWRQAATAQGLQALERTIDLPPSLND